MLEAEKSPDETVALRARLAASAVQTPIYDRLIDDSTLADPYLKGKFATDANDGVRSQFIQKILEIFREEAGDDDFKYYLKYFDPREWQRVRNELVNQIVDAKKEGKDAVSEVLASSIVIGKQTGNVVRNPAEEAKAKRKQFYNPDVFAWVGQQETKYTGQYRSVREGRWDAETERKKAEDEITKRILEAPKDKEGRYKELLIDKNGELTIENIDTAGEAFKRLVDRMIKVFQSQEAISALKTLENSISRAKEEYEALSAVYTDDLDAKMTYIASAKKNAAAMLAKTSNGAEEQSSNEAAAADLVSLGAMNEAMKFLGETSSKIRDVRAASLEGEEKISYELRTANDELVNRAKRINEELLIGLDAFIAKKTSEFNESAKSQNWYSDPAKYSEEQQKLSDVIAEREDETKRLTELIRENTKKLQQVNTERANAEKKRQSLEMTKSLRASAERAKEDYELSENRVNNDFSQKLTTYTSASKSAKGMLESKKTEDPVERAKQQTAAGWMTLYASLQEANNWSLEQKSTIASAEKIGMTRREAADDEFQRSLREIENVTAEIAKTIVSERDQLLTRLQDEFDKEYGTLDKNSKKYREAFDKLNQDKTLVKDLAERELTQNAQTGIDARNAVSKNSTENKKWGLEKTLSDWYDLEKMTDQFTSSWPESFASAIEDALDGTKGT